MQSNISKQQWLDWISEQEQSGLSVAAFCRSKTINLGNFYYHRDQQHKKAHRRKRALFALNYPQSQLRPYC